MNKQAYLKLMGLIKQAQDKIPFTYNNYNTDPVLRSFGVSFKPESFKKVFTDSMGDFGQKWLSKFQQNVRANPTAYSKIFTPNSVRNFSYNFNSQDTVPVSQSNPLLDTGLPEPSPIKNMTFGHLWSAGNPTVISAYKGSSDTKPRYHMLYSKLLPRLYSNISAQFPHPSRVLQPNIERDTGNSIAILNGAIQPNKYVKDAKKHQFLHALTFGGKNRLRLKNMDLGQGQGAFSRNYMPILEKPIFDPYLFSDPEMSQAAMAANQGRNWLADTLRKNPKAFPQISPQTRQYLTKIMPFFWDSKQPERGWAQAEDFYRMVREEPALYQALPPQARRYYAMRREIKEKLPLQPLRRKLYQSKQIPIEFKGYIDDDFAPGQQPKAQADRKFDQWQRKRVTPLRNKAEKLFKRYYLLSQNKIPTRRSYV